MQVTACYICLGTCIRNPLWLYIQAVAIGKQVMSFHGREVLWHLIGSKIIRTMACWYGYGIYGRCAWLAQCISNLCMCSIAVQSCHTVLFEQASATSVMAFCCCWSVNKPVAYRRNFDLAESSSSYYTPSVPLCAVKALQAQGHAHLHQLQTTRKDRSEQRSQKSTWK